MNIVRSGGGVRARFDQDILSCGVRQLRHRKDRGEKSGKRVRFSARGSMSTSNRKTGGVEYQRLEQAFQRLIGTTFQTDIQTGNKRETRFFSLLESGSGFVMKEEGKWRLDYCEVILSDWVMRAIEGDEVVTISNDYFRLRRPLERRLYEIGRKHCGGQPKWQIGLAKLQEKTGSNAPLKKFRLNIRQIIEDDHTPFYRMELTAEDLVIFRPRSPQSELLPEIRLPEWAEDKARTIAREKGRDYYALRSDWLAFAKSEAAKGNPPKSAGAAFVAYCGKKNSLR